jgi:hypothetical protein
MTFFLVISLVIVHHNKPLIELFAQYAASSGCHQQLDHQHHPKSPKHNLAAHHHN